jgi:hypothetical protein
METGAGAERMPGARPYPSHGSAGSGGIADITPAAAD